MLVIDNVFGMGDGYVLNFSSRTFPEFFAEELGVDIDQPRWSVDGTSKAKRLRTYLRQADRETALRTLQALWDYREASSLVVDHPAIDEDGRNASSNHQAPRRYAAVIYDCRHHPAPSARTRTWPTRSRRASSPSPAWIHNPEATRSRSSSRTSSTPSVWQRGLRSGCESERFHARGPPRAGPGKSVVCMDGLVASKCRGDRESSRRHVEANIRGHGIEDNRTDPSPACRASPITTRGCRPPTRGSMTGHSVLLLS